MRFARDDTSLLARWWFTVDKKLLLAVLVLLGAGVVLSLAASPPIAIKRGLPEFHYVERQMLFAALGAGVMLATSFLSPIGVRRISLLLLIVCLVLLIGVLIMGVEVKGASRWIRFAGHSVQPSEFLKPVFAVAMAWLFTKAHSSDDKAALALALGLYVLAVALLVLQPDIGQAVLITLVWGALFFLSGQPIRWALAFGSAGLAGLGIAYVQLAHVRSRIDRFFFPDSGDSYQTDRAIQSFIEGGFFGRGPGEGTIKLVLPDAHSDFIFAVIAEEYGILACLVLLGLFAFVVLRALKRIWHEPDAFRRNAVAGLALLFALQTSINMAVNVGLLPAKGMTLPFISSGGSSTLALALAMGMILALTRHRFESRRHKLPIFTSRSHMAGATMAATGISATSAPGAAANQIRRSSSR